ncbi:MAG: DUF721 domain-containing protein [Ectothiorhodospiraceae bacterium]|nr:DUF721 domain-containing protein [Ectothiorhodospiraceae bacterium]
MTSQPVSKFLSAKNSDLSVILERAQHLQQLTKTLQIAMRAGPNPEIADHISLANLREDTAVVTTDSPAWLTPLRYLAPTILKQLKSQPGMQSLRKVQFKIQPHSQAAIPTQARRATLSADSAHILESAADYIEDGELSDALRRLSQQNHSNR